MYGMFANIYKNKYLCKYNMQGFYMIWQLTGKHFEAAGFCWSTWSLSFIPGVPRPLQKKLTEAADASGNSVDRQGLDVCEKNYTTWWSNGSIYPVSFDWEHWFCLRWKKTFWWLPIGWSCLVQVMYIRYTNVLKLRCNICLPELAMPHLGEKQWSTFGA